MDTRKLIDADLLPLIDALPAIELTDEVLLNLLRDPAAFPLTPAVDLGAAGTEVAVTMETARGLNGGPGVSLKIFRPMTSDHVAMPCIYHIHGGGFVGGSSSQLASLHQRLAYDLRCVIVSVDYRVAPEHPYPAQIEDCYAGLAWTFENAANLGIDPVRIGLKGESAGAGLAAALALYARDRGEWSLSFQHLIYPMLDDRTCVQDEPNAYAGQFIWTSKANRFGWMSLLGTAPGGPEVSQYAAAARATELAGLPPTYIACGSVDLFVDEDIEFAHRLIRAGVPVDLKIYSGAFHGFDIFGGDVPLVARARQDSADALARALGT